MVHQFRLFLSSTFRDMQRERAYFQDIIFPEIDAFCRKRNVEFLPIDLRWGVADDMRLVLETCFHEIDNSRPFFIGMIGYRYGTVPSKEAIDVVREALQARNPQMSQSIIHEGQSVTEMEIDYGLMGSSPYSAVFLMRQKDNAIETRCDERDLSLLAKQVALRDKIHQSGHACYPYTTIEEYGELLKRSIISFVERRFTGDEATDLYVSNQELIATHESQSLYMPVAYMRFSTWYFSSVPLLYCTLDFRGAGGWSTSICQFLTIHQQNGNRALYIDSSLFSSQPDQANFLLSYIERHIAPDDKNPIVCIEHIELLSEDTWGALSLFIDRHSDEWRFIITGCPRWLFVSCHPRIECACPKKEWDRLYTMPQKIQVIHHIVKNKYGKEIPRAYWERLLEIARAHNADFDPPLGNILLALQVVQGLEPSEVPGELARGFGLSQSVMDLGYWMVEMTYRRAERYHIQDEVKRVMAMLAVIRFNNIKPGVREEEIWRDAQIDAGRWPLIRPFILPFCDRLDGNLYTFRWPDIYDAVGDYKLLDYYENKFQKN